MMIKYYEASVIHVPYICFLFLGFLTALNHWAVLYQLKDRSRWTIMNVAILFLSGMIIYAISIVASPEEQGFNYNYEAFYHSIFSKFCGMTIVMISMLVFESRMLNIQRTKMWYVALGGFTLLMISGLIIQNQSYRNLVGVAMLTLQVINVIINKFEVLEER